MLTILSLLVVAQPQVWNNGVRVHPSPWRVNLNGHVSCSRNGNEATCGFDGGVDGARADAGFVIVGATSGSPNELQLVSSGYNTLNTSTPWQVKYDWIHGLTCGSGAVFTSSGTAAMACVSNVATATALASNPSDCAAQRYAAAIDASGNLTCTQVEINGTLGTLDGTHGGLGAVQPTRSADQYFTCNGTTCSFASQDSWTACTFLNSFSDLGGLDQTCGYFKDANGIVHLRGTVKRATAALNTAIFTLPAGYRPALWTNFATMANRKFASLEVKSTGDVVIRAADDANWFNFFSVQAEFDTR